MPRILLLVVSRENRRLLTQCLEEEHEVYAPDPLSEAGRAALDETTWDLCILDGPVLDACWRKVKLRKTEDENQFLPFLLVTSHKHVKSTTRQLWRLVDEVILTPIEKDELVARVEILLRAQRYPRRWSERYTTLTEVAPVGIVSLDVEGVVTYANAQAEEMLADGRGTVVGRPADAWPATDFEGSPYPIDESPFYRVARRKEPVHNMQIAIERPGRERLLLSVNGAPLFDEAGQLNGVLCSFDDVTERERRVQELREAKEEAEAMNRLKSSFLANMSHEIRTPLTSLIGFAEVLAEEAQDADRETVAFIQQSGQRLHDTLTSLLDFSQLESGALELCPERVDMTAELRMLCRPFAARAAGQDLNFQLELPDRPVEACLDRSALGRILDNLLSNALKFTREGGITVTLDVDGEDFAVRVADTGVGIDAAFVPELFEPFRQESRGLARDFEGTGLGLAITRELVELMGGTIDVETRKGTGTTFQVVLPRNVGELREEAAPDVPDAPNAPNAPDAPDAPDAPAPAGEPPAPDRSSVLVVEDNVETRHLLRHLLSSAHEVTVADSGEEALERAAEQCFDAVLLDISLGEGISGEAVLHALRLRDLYRSTPVLALTAHALPGDRDRLLEAGFDGYLSKPFQRRELLQAVRLLVALGASCSETDSPEHLDELLEAAARQVVVEEYGRENDMVALQYGRAYLRVPSERALPALRHVLSEV